MANCLIREQMMEVGRQRSGPASARLLFQASIFSLLSSVSCPLLAEDLPDPTRPPASIFDYAAGGGQEAMESHLSGLHTIIISENRRAAIIDGQTVELWGDHGGAKLVEVNEGNVVLQRGQNRQVLTLFPGVKLTHKEAKKPQIKQPASANKAQPGQPKETK